MSGFSTRSLATLATQSLWAVLGGAGLLAGERDSNLPKCDCGRSREDCGGGVNVLR